MSGRYARQSVLPEVGPEGQTRLAAARVLVIGAGGLGCIVLQYLCAAGVGQLVVLDPVLRASSGGVLLEAAAYEPLRSRLLPRITLLTPNLPEAACLAGEAMPCSPDPPRILGGAHRLLAEGMRAVLIKGGHASGEQAAERAAGADLPQACRRGRAHVRTLLSEASAGQRATRARGAAGHVPHTRKSVTNSCDSSV